MRVKDAMSPISAIVGPEHTLQQAAVRMVQNGTGAAVVVDHDLPGPGVVTERDLLRAVAAGDDPATARVEDRMTHQVVTAAPDWPITDAATVMVKHGVRHVLVFEGSELVGILSMRDVVRVGGLGRVAQAAAPEAGA
jgi:signal-transduction protein with cAMP-binding, CBS, and nucleotidyltransferase domain